MPAHFGDEPRFADAGLAADGDDAALAASQPVDALVQHPQLRLAAGVCRELERLHHLLQGRAGGDDRAQSRHRDRSQSPPGAPIGTRRQPATPPGAPAGSGASLQVIVPL